MQRFGGRQPTGTPSLAWSSVVVIVSLLAGASIVHNIYKPDLGDEERQGGEREIKGLRGY
ncbi:hypothetical protein AMTRI_Chr05g66450 [Amborella trichopoda]